MMCGMGSRKPQTLINLLNNVPRKSQLSTKNGVITHHTHNVPVIALEPRNLATHICPASSPANMFSMNVEHHFRINGFCCFVSSHPLSIIQIMPSFLHSECVCAFSRERKKKKVGLFLKQKYQS
jgi:hypothetical protein